MAKKNETWLDLLFGTTSNSGHNTNKRKSNWDKHSGANRNEGSKKPNTKSSVRERRRRNGG